jgi:hypothetical protein
MNEAPPKKQPGPSPAPVHVEGALQAAQTQIKALTIENQLLRQKLDALVRRVFGTSKNEGLDPAQLQLLLAGLTPVVPVPAPAPAPAPATPTRANRDRKPARSGIPENLPIDCELGLLYALEKRLRRGQAGPQLRQAARSSEARMILARIKKAMDRITPQVPLQSLLGKALNYMLDFWPALNRYVEHEQCEIDSNQIENAVRPTAVGKMNLLFIGHLDAGWRSAVTYSIMGTCRPYRIDPAKHIKDVLTRLPLLKAGDTPSLTPREWAKAHPEARTLPPEQPAASTVAGRLHRFSPSPHAADSSTPVTRCILPLHRTNALVVFANWSPKREDRTRAPRCNERDYQASSVVAAVLD